MTANDAPNSIASDSSARNNSAPTDVAPNNRCSFKLGSEAPEPANEDDDDYIGHNCICHDL